MFLPDTLGFITEISSKNLYVRVHPTKDIGGFLNWYSIREIELVCDEDRNCKECKHRLICITN